jgi:hypothetical protein
MKLIFVPDFGIVNRSPSVFQDPSRQARQLILFGR